MDETLDSLQQQVAELRQENEELRRERDEAQAEPAVIERRLVNRVQDLESQVRRLQQDADYSLVQSLREQVRRLTVEVERLTEWSDRARQAEFQVRCLTLQVEAVRFYLTKWAGNQSVDWAELPLALQALAPADKQLRTCNVCKEELTDFYHWCNLAESRAEGE